MSMPTYPLLVATLLLAWADLPAARGATDSSVDLKRETTPVRNVSTTLQPDRWRYVRHNNAWWYYTPQNRWMVYRNNAWAPYAPRPYVTGYRGPAFYGGYGYYPAPYGTYYRYNARPYYPYGPRYYRGYRGWRGGRW